MEKHISVYEINETINGVKLNKEKIANIANIVDIIIGVLDGKTNHKAIIAEIKDNESLLKEYYTNKDNYQIKSFVEKLLLAEKGNKAKRKKVSEKVFLFVRKSKCDLTLLKKVCKENS